MENGDVYKSPGLNPVREDQWTEEATETLIEAWGERFNRGNLGQHHWQQVADAVNSRHALLLRNKTDIQCKNRLDTLKKKYKLEKLKHSSLWPFLSHLDHLLGPRYKRKVRDNITSGSSESSKSSRSGSWERGERCLAEAIEKVEEIYERVERDKQSLMVEVEKQRMMFAKELEIQRMKMFMESQLQMEKIREDSRKRGRYEDDDDSQGVMSAVYCLFNA